MNGRRRRIFDVDRHSAIVDARDPYAIRSLTAQLVARTKEVDYDKLVSALRKDAEKTLASYGYPTSLEQITADKIEIIDKAALDAQDVLIRLCVLQNFVACGNAKMAAIAMMGATAGNLRQNERIMAADAYQKRADVDVGAKERARELAKNAWSIDGTLRMGEVSDRVRDQLAIEGRKEYRSKSIRDWIRDIAPAEASKPGRSRKKEQQSPL